MSRSKFCATCGRPRGISLLRSSWQNSNRIVFVPRTENPDYKPWQVANDLICSVNVYRNGGTGSDTHLCDECLKVAIREIYKEISPLIDEPPDVLNSKIAELSDTIARLQIQLNNLCHDHNRMQDRLNECLQQPNVEAQLSDGLLSVLKFEIERGHAKNQKDG